MGIKVISRGVPEAEKRYRVTCRHCKSELEVSKADGRTRSNMRDGDDWSCTCPVCLETVCVNYPSGLRPVQPEPSSYITGDFWRDR